MFRLPTLVSLLVLALPKAVLSSPCVAFDANFNLLAFGLDGKDWNAGPQSSWSSGSASEITATGRPPFDGANTTCYLAQFFNTVYVLNGDQSNPSDVYIYDAGSTSWTKQTTTPGSFDTTNFVAILDHDTNVFYALSQDTLYYLDMGEMTAANATALTWVDVEAAPYSSSYTQPVMALAQNHVHFINVPGASQGTADIFVIHYSYFQPAAQAYPTSNGSASFPETYGKTASFFQASGVQQEFAFIPEDSSNTYVINVETNTTAVLAGPTTKDPNAYYYASINALVQLDSNGGVSYMPYVEGDESTNAQATWSAVANLAAVAPPGSSSSAAPSGTSSATNSSATGSGKSSGSSTSSSNTTNAGFAVRAGFPVGAAAALAVLAFVL